SQIVGQGPGGVPQTLQNKIETSLVVGNGESAALGGMIGEERKVSFDRNPGSSSAPADNFELINVGRSQTFDDSKRQFIVFVTPNKIRTPTESTNDLKRKFRLRR